MGQGCGAEDTRHGRRSSSDGKFWSRESRGGPWVGQEAGNHCRWCYNGTSSPSMTQHENTTLLVYSLTRSTNRFFNDGKSNVMMVVWPSASGKPS